MAARWCGLGEELRDRFGKLPPAMEHLLLVGELKVIASGKGVDSIVADRDRLKLRRAGDYISLGGKFPRLTKKKPGPACGEVKSCCWQCERRAASFPACGPWLWLS